MVRLADLPDYEREHLLAKNLPPLEPPAWTRLEKPLAEMRLALITTAGLHLRGDAAFDFADAGFRPIPNEADAGSLVTSHSSANFDRSGFAEDVNLVFPIDRFREPARITASWAPGCRRGRLQSLPGSWPVCCGGTEWTRRSWPRSDRTAPAPCARSATLLNTRAS